MFKIGLVADEHDDDVGIGVVAQFFEPPRHVDIGRVLCDVVDQQRADSSAVVPARSSVSMQGVMDWTVRGGAKDARGGDGAIALLAG